MKFIKEWIGYILYLLVCAGIIIAMYFCFRPILVNGNSMNPTYEHHDLLIASKVAYRNHNPEINDIVVVDANSKGLDTYIIKRIVAVEGDKVKIKNGRLYVNNKKVDDTFGKINEDMKEVTVEKNQVFIMGDNRNHSSDSRDFGTVSINDIFAKIVFEADWFKGIGHLLPS